MKPGRILTLGTLLGTLLGTVTFNATAQDVDRSHRERGMSVRSEHATSRPVSEHRGAQRSLIERADTDNDGFVSQTEFVEIQTANTDSNFNHRDRNGDGNLDRDEAGERERPGLDINLEELRECIASYGENPEPEIDRFDVADVNGDGLLSFVEFATYLQERAHVLFDRIDADNDGYISEAEVQADHDHRENYRRIVKACMEEVRSPE